METVNVFGFIINIKIVNEKSFSFDNLLDEFYNGTKGKIDYANKTFMNIY